MAEIKIDLGALLLQNKKTYIAVAAGIVTQIMTAFGYTDPAIATKITNVAYLLAIAFLGARITRFGDLVSETLNSAGVQQETLDGIMKAIGIGSESPTEEKK